jgi:hypothetical protein
MKNPTRSDETVSEVIEEFRPIRLGTELRLMEVGRAAVESSPSEACNQPLARAAMSRELQELDRLNRLADRLVANSE